MFRWVAGTSELPFAVETVLAIMVTVGKCSPRPRSKESGRPREVGLQRASAACHADTTDTAVTPKPNRRQALALRRATSPRSSRAADPEL